MSLSIVCLAGFPGSGKTAIGERLSVAIGWKIVSVTEILDECLCESMSAARGYLITNLRYTHEIKALAGYNPKIIWIGRSGVERGTDDMEIEEDKCHHIVENRGALNKVVNKVASLIGFYIKEMGPNEYQFMNQAEGLVPRIVNCTKTPHGRLCVVMEKYETTYGEFCEDFPVTPEINEKIRALIHDLHDRGILHGDLHCDNIVMRMQTDGWDIRLIDFGKSRIISSLQQADVDFFTKFWGCDWEIDNVPGLLRYEHSMYKD
jgi:serine/threonine protein kinase